MCLNICLLCHICESLRKQILVLLKIKISTVPLNLKKKKKELMRKI